MENKIVFAAILSLFGSSFIWLIVEKLIWTYIRLKVKKELPERKEFTMLAFSYGAIELFMFSFSLLFGIKEFILLWMGLKTALKWDRSSGNSIVSGDTFKRGAYYSALIGNALSIIISYAIASIVNCGLIEF